MLLVEDDEMVRESATACLHEAGYRVLQAACVEDAKQVLEHKSSIAMVITDVVMPGEEDGYDLAKFIKQSSPDIQVLVMSGYIGDDRLHAPNVPFLQKPFSNNALLTKINDLLKPSA